MTSFDHSIAIIVPASLRDKANRLTCALGHDQLPGTTFSIPLSAGGQELATHYGCRTWAKQEFVDLMADGGEGELPEIDWSEYDLTPEEVLEIIAAKKAEVKGAGEYAGQLEAFAEIEGLKQVQYSDITNEDE